MDNLPPKTTSNKFNEWISYYLEDDKLRLLFIVILLIGMILLITGVKQALLFMLVGFGILAFICIFKKKPKLLENFICDTLNDIDSIPEDTNHSRIESQIGITIIQNTKFKNSTRN